MGVGVGSAGGAGVGSGVAVAVVSGAGTEVAVGGGIWVAVRSWVGSGRWVTARVVASGSAVGVLETVGGGAVFVQATRDQQGYERGQVECS